MKYLYLIGFLFFCLSVSAQTINGVDLSKVDVDSLSDAQVEGYWLKVKNQGYSINDIDQIGKLQGLSSSDIAKIKSRIQNLSATDNSSSDSVDLGKTKSVGEASFGKEVIANSGGKSKQEIFGIDFFNNPNISFEPNLNLATPKNYQLGPGDGLVISVWGAAENNYDVTINPDGSIRIPDIGPIFISGLSIEMASKKVTSALKRIYDGIRAQDNSPYKVYVDIALTNVRRVQIDIIGEVTVPGTYSLTALSSLMNALYAAGGPSENGTFRNILHVRNGSVINNLDVYDYLISGSGNGNSTLEDQDVIIIRPYKKRVSVSGAVKRPGLYEVKENETFNDLELFFGGFSSKAYKDRVIVKRIEGEELSIKEVNLTTDSKTHLKDGDNITVSGIVEKYNNRISISGAVNKPGEYELTEGLKLSDLLEKALGVADGAFMERGVIYRLEGGYKKIVMPFSVSDVSTGKFNLELQKDDSVYVFTKNGLKGEETVSIGGAVNNPKVIPYVENLTIKDFIIMAGGFKEGANPAVINVSRKINDEDFETQSETFLSPKVENFKVSQSDEFYLKPFDRVIVRYLKGYTNIKNVKIVGEVEYPGSYSIVNKNDRVSDLIKHSGGVSPYAFLEGATLLRDTSENNLKEQESAIVKNISRLEFISNSEGVGGRASIGLDLDKILNGGEGSKYDLILQAGDVLSIPSQKQTVQVKGEVLSPSLIRYDKGKKLKSYVNGSGGFSSNARKRKVYVVYSNGEVKATKSFLFFRNFPKLKPGSTILVPPRPVKKDRISAQEIIGLTTGLGTIGLLIDRLLIN